MSKPKDFDSWPPEKQAEWKAKENARKNEWAKRKFRESSEYRDKIRARKRAWQNRWYTENPEEARDRGVRHRKENPDLCKAASRRDYDKRKAVIRKKCDAYLAAHPEKHKQYRERIERRRIQEIRDAYLACCRGITVAQLRQYPRPVIDLWKTLLKLSRIRKQIKTEINERDKRNE